MTLTKKKSLLILTFSFVFISSCETLEDLAGLNKVSIDDSLYSSTPDLILPPDFNKDPASLKTSKKSPDQPISQPNHQLYRLTEKFHNPYKHQFPSFSDPMFSN